MGRTNSNWVGGKFPCLVVVGGLAISFLLASPAQAASTYWWNSTTTGLWGTSTDWWTSAVGTSNSGTFPGSADTAIFNGTGVTGAEIVQLGSAAAATNLIFNNTGTTTLESSSNTPNTLTLSAGSITINSGAGALTLGDSTNQMPITLSGAQTWTNNATSLMTVVNPITNGSNNLSFGAGSFTLDGAVGNGSGEILKNGSGTLTLNVANTLTGGVKIGTVSSTSGVVLLGANNALGSGTLDVEGGTLNMGTFSSTVAGINSVSTWEGSGAILGSGTLTVSAPTSMLAGWSNNTGTNTISVALAGPLTINHNSGKGNLLYLTNPNNSFTGGLNIGDSAATDSGLTNFVSGALGTGNITFGGNAHGTLQWATGNTQDVSSQIVISNGDIAFIDTNGNNVTFASAFGGNGSGGLTKYGAGTLTLAAANTYSGATTVAASAGTIALNNALAVQNSTITVAANSVFFFGTGIGTFTAGGLAGASNLSLADSGSNPILLQVGNNNGTASYSGILSGSGTLAKVGTGIQTLSGSDGYAGGTIINAGTLQFAATNSMPSAGTVAVNSGGVLDVSAGGTGQFTTAASGSGSIGGLLLGTGAQGNAVTWAAGAGLGIDTTGSSGTLTYSNVIANPGGNLLNFAKFGTKTLVLGNANTYTGSTSISNGTLSVGSLNYINSGTWGTPSASSLGAPTTVANGTINLGSGANAAELSYTGAGETTDRVINLAGTTGGVVLDQSGSGPLKFTSNLTFTGTGAKTLTLQGSTVGTGEIDGIIADSAVGNATALTKLGTGMWTLGAANTYSGATTVSAGTLLLGVNNAIGSSSAVTVNGATAMLALSGNTASVAGLTVTAGTVNGPGTMNCTSFTYTTAVINTNMTDSGGITTGTSVTFNGIDNFSLGGSTTLGGDLIVSSGQTTFTGAGYIQDGYHGTGELDVTGGTLNLAMAGGIALPNADGGSGGHGYLRVSAGSLAVAGAIAGHSGAGPSAMLFSGGTATLGAISAPSAIAFEVTGTGQVSAGALSGTSLTAVSVSGSGSASFSSYSSTNAASNGTFLSGGQLSVNAGALSLSDSTAVYLSGGTLLASAISTPTLALNGAYIKTGAATTSLITNVNGASVYTGGVTIDTTGGSATIATSLLGTSGSACTGIPVTANGNGSYAYTVPTVTFTGGVGTTATGIGDFNTLFGVSNISIGSPGQFTTLPTSVSLSVAGATLGTPTYAANSLGGLTKVGPNTLVLSAANSYQGPTTVNGGTLAVSGNGNLADTAGLSVAGGATFSYFPTVPATTLTLGSAGTLNLANNSTIAETLGSTIAAPGAATTAGEINLLTSGTVAPNTVYTLLTATGGLNGASYDLSNPTYPFTLTVSGTSVQISTPASVAQLPTGYWLGGQSNFPSVWALSAGSASNWTVDGNGTPTGQVPGAATNVVFSDVSAAAGNQVNMTLGANMAVNSLSVNSANPVSLANSGAYTLTLGSGAGAGITLNAGAGAVTLNPNLVLGTSQSWTNNSSNSLTVNGAVNNGGFLLTLAGTGSSGISAAISGTGGLTQTGGQWTLSGNNIYTGATTASGGTLSFTGSNSLGASAINVNGGGTLTNSGTIATTGLLTVGTGLLNVSAGSLAVGAININGGGTLTNSGTIASVGSLAVANAAGTGMLNISGNLAATAIEAGTVTGAAGAVFQSGGSVSLTAESDIGGNTSNQPGYGYYSLSGGTLNTSSYLMIGNYGPGQMDVTGGYVKVTGNYIQVGRFAGGTGVLNISGGTVDGTGLTTGVSGFAIPSQGNGVLNVSNTGLVNLGSVPLSFGWSSSGGNGIVNLSGGTISTKQVLKQTGTATFDFNGGVLQAAASASSASFFTGLNNAYIYPGGATFDTNNQAITVAQALLAPSGSGVITIPVTNGGSGYVAPPVLTISGGGGAGVTAIANISGGSVSSITITNPGVNYTSSTLTISASGGGGSGLTFGTPTLAANSSGGLTKQGIGTLTLTASSNYAGGSRVTAGMLQMGNVAALGTGGLTVNGGTLDLHGYSVSVPGISGAAGTILSTSAAAVTVTTTQSGATAFGGTLQNGSGTLALVMNGSGSLSLLGTNSSYTGATTVSNGTLAFASIGNADGATASALGAPPAVNGTITLGSPIANTGGYLQFAGSASSASNRLVYVTTNSTIDASGSSGATLTLTGSTAVNMGDNGVQLTLAGSGTGIIQNVITGIPNNGNTLLKTGPGAWTLGSSSNFDSAAINAGTLVLGGTMNLYTGGALTLNGGTLTSGAAATVTGAIAAGSGLHYILPGAQGPGGIGTLTVGGLSLNSNSVLQFTVSSPSTLDQITDNGSLSIGGGTVEVPSGLANGSYELIGYNSGSPSPSALSLESLTGGSAPGNYQLTASGGSLDLVVGGSVTATSTSYSLAVSPATAQSVHVGSSLTLTGSIANTGTNGANSDQLAFTGFGLSADGGTLSGGSLPLANGTLNVSSGTSGAASFSSNTAGSFTITPTAAGIANATIGNGGGAPTLSGSNSATVNVYNYAAPSVAATTVNLGAIHAGGSFVPQSLAIANTAASSYSEGLDAVASSGGAATITSGGTITNLSAGGPSAIPDTSIQVSLTPSLGGSVSGTVTLSMSSNGSTTSGLGETPLNPATIAVQGTVFSGTGVWAGTSGSWGTTGNAGNWSGGAAPGTFAGYLNTDTATFSGSGSATTVDLTGANPSLKSLVFSTSAYTLSNGTLTLASNDSTTPTIDVLDGTTQTIGSTIAGTQGLELTGPGTLILTNSGNTFSGGTTVAEGTLVLQSSGALADGSSLTVGDASLFAPVIPGAGGGAALTAVPEPGTLALAGLGMLALVMFRSRRKR